LALHFVDRLAQCKTEGEAIALAGLIARRLIRQG